MKKTLSLLVLALFVTSVLPAQELKKAENQNQSFHQAYTPSFKEDGSRKKIKNVILMIGDGMGLAQLSSGMYSNKGELTITNLKTSGFVRTQSASNFVTDSAASGTAYACGIKTYNGAIGLDPDKKEVSNLTEKLSAQGYATGIVTTDLISGATPSAFYAHQSSRKMSKEILGDLPNSQLDFFAGGNLETVQKTRPELFDELKDAGFTVVESFDAMPQADRIGVLPEAKYTAKVLENRGDFLPKVTSEAIEFLKEKSPKGFFLMVEGALIDKGGHANSLPTVVSEVLDFDQAVEAAIRFAEKDGHTLVVISADHETGGLCLFDGNINEGTLSGSFSAGGHSSIMVPLFAYGPFSDLFSGVQENSDVSNKIFELMSK